MNKLYTLLTFAVLMVACSPQQAPKSGALPLTNTNTVTTLNYSVSSTTTPPPVTTTVSQQPAFKGVDFSSGEWGNSNPGTYGVDYTYAKNSEVDYFVAKGMNLFRVGFTWERLQDKQMAPLRSADVTRLKSLVDYATSKGAVVIIEPHNFARYYGQLIGSTTVPYSAFGDFWSKTALVFKDNPKVWLNLVNEPNTMPTEQWVTAANTAIKAIRDAGVTNKIVVPGNAWTAGWFWNDTWYGTPNAKALLNVVDSGNNMIFEAHQYLDSDGSGSSPTCVSTTEGSKRLKPFVDWLRANKKQGMIGEFAGGNNPTCLAALDDMLTYMKANADVLTGGWIWWAAGPWWKDAYVYRVEPTADGKDTVLMNLLSKYTATTTTTVQPPPVTVVTNLPVKVTISTISSWSTGYCVSVYLYNDNPVDIVWKSMQVNINDMKLRDVWGGTSSLAAGSSGVFTFTPNQPWSKDLKSKSTTVNFGFCGDRGASGKVITVSNLQ